MEPWLDSLSEDWKSEHNSSSLSFPNQTPPCSRPGSISSNASASRIPHLALNHSKSTSNGKYLRSRSLRGTPPFKNPPALAEQNPSKLNVTAQQSTTTTFESQRKHHATALPRRASSVLSDSAQSVQHYTLPKTSTLALDDDDIPEWKRRLARGEEITGNGCDLFGPSRLEGMFKAPQAPQDENQPTRSSPSASPFLDQPRLWSLPYTLPGTSTIGQFQSMKSSRSRLPGLEIVTEVSEEADTPSVSSRVVTGPTPKGSLLGLAKQQPSSLECSNSVGPQKAALRAGIVSSTDNSEFDHLCQEPRTRTISEQEELRNEWISPVILSREDSVRDRAPKDSLDKSTAVLHAKLEQLGIDDSRRPLSRSSDEGVVYGHSPDSSGHFRNNEMVPDLTSQSLPDDLSMGTQDFISQGGFVNKRRGGFSSEGSFHRKTLSPSGASPHRDIAGGPTSSVSHSSLLLSVSAGQDSDDRYPVSVTSPMSSPTSGHAQHHKLPSLGSPLKLFGNRDTYTNNKLLRVLNHFEDSELDGDADPTEHGAANRVEGELRMSQFGQGELDQFAFIEEVKLKTDYDEQHVDVDSQMFSGLVYSEPLHPASSPSEDRCSKSARIQRNFQPPFAPNQGNHELEDMDSDQAKRNPPSPLKERTPKRRRTLLGQEIEEQLPRQLEDTFVVPRRSSSKLAGTKRKDARYDDAAPTINPESLASRQMLRPRMAYRQTSKTASEDGLANPTVDAEARASSKPGSVAIREAVAEELVQVIKDARKTSVTTQDYMEEATKIMQMIRAKGKPKSGLTSVDEPVETSKLNSDALPGPDMDEISSGDEFSRPPSRNGGISLRQQRRPQQYDPRIASHLRKFKESDDLELLIDTSVLEPMPIPDNAQAEEAALVPIPEDEQRSSPPNIRIRDNLEIERKRKHSTSTTEDAQGSQHNTTIPTQSSSTSSTQRTIPTSSTGSSSRRGVINPGTVQIPDQIGAMTFDHAAKTWVKECVAQNISATDRRAQQATSEEDPFEHISDLSTEEGPEAEPKDELRAIAVPCSSHRGPSPSNEHTSIPKINCEESEMEAEAAQPLGGSQTTTRSQLVEHETRIHDGRVSRPPNSPQHVNKQPRVVTIAFSSPLVSAVAYQDDPSTSEMDINLTAHISEGLQQISSTANDRPTDDTTPKQEALTKQPACLNSSRRMPRPCQGFVGRPVSRIEEREEVVANEDMSLITTGKSQAMTPTSHRSERILAVPHTTGKTSSIICLTPLSDFSLHQADRPSHEEASFVAPRRHPAALRQAHGSLALGVDDMMRAITDVEPFEPYWDHIRRLNLTGKHLTTLHRLEEYCSTLEELAISSNDLRQLSGVPSSIRTLDVQRNLLSNMTSWGHLQNLQYLDISGNELESLEGLSCLYHLRELNANDNKITDIDGILDLNGLQSLGLRGNELESLDFEGGELTRLTRLDASRNRLAHVHNLSWLPALEDLNLEQNILSEFATLEPIPLGSLRRLRISTNKLRIIDISAFQNIESLYLDRNNITEIRSLDSARHLHTLSLREQTDSPDIVGQVLSSPNDCRKIFLSSNVVPDGKLRLPCQPLFSLRYLELASCGISSLPAGFGTKIPNCRVLNMNFNALGCISRLQGMFHLNKLLLAGNRLERLRRSCLALSRHPALTKVDLRNNPLTVGFYSPAPLDDRLIIRNPSQPDLPELHDPYVLPRQVKIIDLNWVRLLDEGTRLRRRTIELLLAQKCADLVDLDGLKFDRDEILEQDKLWKALTELGVLKRPMLLQQGPFSEHEEDLPSRNHVQARILEE
jgi:protein NUD1